MRGLLQQPGCDTDHLRHESTASHLFRHQSTCTISRKRKQRQRKDQSVLVEEGEAHRIVQLRTCTSRNVDEEVRDDDGRTSGTLTSPIIPSRPCCSTRSDSRDHLRRKNGEKRRKGCKKRRRSRNSGYRRHYRRPRSWSAYDPVIVGIRHPSRSPGRFAIASTLLAYPPPCNAITKPDTSKPSTDPMRKPELPLPFASLAIPFRAAWCARAHVIATRITRTVMRATHCARGRAYLALIVRRRDGDGSREQQEEGQEEDEGAERSPRKSPMWLSRPFLSSTCMLTLPIAMTETTMTMEKTTETTTMTTRDKYIASERESTVMGPRRPATNTRKMEAMTARMLVSRIIRAMNTNMKTRLARTTSTPKGIRVVVYLKVISGHRNPLRLIGRGIANVSMATDAST